MEQIGVALDFFAFYTASKVAKTGLTVTCTVRNRVGTALATDQAATELGNGFYRYTLASGSNTQEDMLIARFTTTDTTVDQRDIPALWVVSKGGIENLDAAVSSRNNVAPDNAGISTLTGRLSATRAGYMDNLPNLDALVSSRNAIAPNNAGIASIIASLATLPAAVWDVLLASHTTPGSAAVIVSTILGYALDGLTAAEGVWDEVVAGHAAGTTGAALAAAGSAADPLTNPVPGTYVAGTAGYALGQVASLDTADVEIISPMSPTGDTISLIQGDSYNSSEDRALEWASADWPSLVGASIIMRLTGRTTTTDYTCSVAGGVVSLELSAAQTMLLLGNYSYRLIATLADGHTQTLARGTVIVERTPVP